MKRLLINTLLILVIGSCKSEFQSFSDRALTYANDKRIDEDEYKTLIDEISGTEEKGFKQFKGQNDKIDDEKVRAYLVKLFNAKKLTLTENDIWQAKISSSQKTFNVNVFLENSASMDGYVKGVTEFETAIYNLLGDVKISGLCDSLNLNYINKSIPYKKENALPSDIQDFIEKLEPSVFKQRGGDRSVSDIKNILNTVLKAVNDKNAAILVSDFVFSPGKSTNAADYLNNQSVGIKIDFAEKLKHFDLSAIVLQLVSSFNGLYYDKTDKPHHLAGKRPYYIWVFGSDEQIKSILQSKILENVRNGYSHKLVFHSVQETLEPDFKILNSPKIGTFSSKELNNKIISEAAPSKNERDQGLFGFNLAVDFSNSFHDADYFLDTTNYLVSDKKYKLKVEPIADVDDPSLSGYSHLINMQTTNLREENLKVSIIGQLPSWVNESSSLNDENIINDPIEQSKTFGLKFLIEGITDAFYRKSITKPIYSITITIRK